MKRRVLPLYLYAIVRARPRGPLGKGIGRSEMDVVRAGRVFVVVERMESAPRASTASLRGHDRAVRRIADRVPALLPFRFGAVVEDAARIASLVEPVTPLVLDALALVRGCIQFTLRVHGRAAPRGAPRGGPGTRFLARLLEARRVPEIDPITEAAAPFVRATRAERHDRPPLLASVYHLVPREHERAYRRALSRPTPGVRLSVSGPFPPYAFAELT